MAFEHLVFECMFCVRMDTHAKFALRTWIFLLDNIALDGVFIFSLKKLLCAIELPDFLHLTFPKAAQL